MKKLLFVLLMGYFSFVKADAMMTSNMILSSTVLMSGALATDENPTDNADFFINNHRVVQNTAVDIRHITTTSLLFKKDKKEYINDTLSILYSFNHQPFTVLSSTSFAAFNESLAYITVEKIEYKNHKATVYITVLDKAGHEEVKKQHQYLLYVVLGIATFFLLLLALFMISLG